MTPTANDAGRTLGVGIVGAGNIAGRYADDLDVQPGLRLVAVTDIDAARSAALAADHGARAAATLDELLADPDVDVVVNLTSHGAHVTVTRQCLEAGKHVFSEKPFALDVASARELVALAKDRGVRLGSAPSVCLGDIARTMAEWISAGRLGTIRLVYADVNWGRIETWHPAPQGFYEVGPLFDVGVYPLTLATGLFGPARRVTAVGRTLMADRTTIDGSSFRATAPDFVAAVVELDGGPLVRLTTNFYVDQHARQRGIELHGDLGALWASSWMNFVGEIEHAPWGEPARPVVTPPDPAPELPWAEGVAELARSVVHDRPMRAARADHAAHVIEVITAALESARTERPVEIASSFDPVVFG